MIETIRPVTDDDVHLLYEWVNDPIVRQSAFKTDIISWKEHEFWFDYKLNDPECYQFIGVDDKEKDVGQIRFDFLVPKNKVSAQIDISIDKGYRRNGYGVQLLNLGIERLLKTFPILVIHAFIKQTNVASIKMFEKAGFDHGDLDFIEGNTALHMVRVIK